MRPRRGVWQRPPGLRSIPQSATRADRSPQTLQRDGALAFRNTGIASSLASCATSVPPLALLS